MKDPLTVKYFQKTFKPLIKDKSTYKNIESHVKGCESLEKSWSSKPLDKKAIQLLNNSLNNVSKTVGAVKKPDGNLKAEMLRVQKAINDFIDDFNKNFVNKISSQTIGSIPGGLKALKAIGIKEWSQENTAFREDTKALKAGDAGALLTVYTKHRDSINLPNKLFKTYDATKNEVVRITNELKVAAKEGNDGARKVLLKEFKSAVNNFYKTTQLVRKEIIKLQNDGVLRFKNELTMK